MESSSYDHPNHLKIGARRGPRVGEPRLSFTNIQQSESGPEVSGAKWYLGETLNI